MQRPRRPQQVALRVSAEVFDDPLRFGVPPHRNRFEPKVGGELDVLGARPDDVGDDASLQTPHPIGQHDSWHAFQFLEALGQQLERCCARLIGAEPHEAVPTPGQDRAEDVAATLLGPIDDQARALVLETFSYTLTGAGFSSP